MTDDARRRDDPLGRRALFDVPADAPGTVDELAAPDAGRGRHALFSTGPRRSGTVVVTCRDCGDRGRISLVDLGVRFLSISAWIPGRPYGHWMRCPSCDRHTWCSVGWLD